MVFKIEVVRNLEFFKFEVLLADTFKRVNMRYHAKFRADQSNCYRRRDFFQITKWRLSAMSDFQKHEILTAGRV